MMEQNRQIKAEDKENKPPPSTKEDLVEKGREKESNDHVEKIAPKKEEEKEKKSATEKKAKEEVDVNMHEVAKIEVVKDEDEGEMTRMLEELRRQREMDSLHGSVHTNICV